MNAATGAGAYAASLAGRAAGFRYDALNSASLRRECEVGLAAASRLIKGELTNLTAQNRPVAA
ncbi:hypothetical protein [Streptomyces sp. NPDC047009]|uniref:hypothetical protein n=1 Tax=unclassified Streptomyces TaxID=2593676 RepID=UPI0034104DC9